MKSLCLALIDAACFIELSPEGIIDQDAAVGALEQMAAVMGSASSVEQDAFLDACTEAASAEPRTTRSQFISELPSSLGIGGGRVA